MQPCAHYAALHSAIACILLKAYRRNAHKVQPPSARASCHLIKYVNKQRAYASVCESAACVTQSFLNSDSVVQTNTICLPLNSPVVRPSLSPTVVVHAIQVPALKGELTLDNEHPTSAVVEGRISRQDYIGLSTDEQHLSRRRER